jgi:hypothetical protein
MVNAIYMILPGHSYQAAEKEVGFNDSLWHTVFPGHIHSTNVLPQESRTPLWSAAAWLGLAKFYQTERANARALLLYSTYSSGLIRIVAPRQSLSSPKCVIQNNVLYLTILGAFGGGRRGSDRRNTFWSPNKVYIHSGRLD